MLSFGLTDKTRQALGTNGVVVHKNSAAYNIGGASGVVLQTAIVAATVPVAVAQFGAPAAINGAAVGLLGLKVANVLLDRVDPSQTASGWTAATLLLPARMAGKATLKSGKAPPPEVAPTEAPSAAAAPTGAPTQPPEPGSAAQADAAGGQRVFYIDDPKGCSSN